MNMTTNRTVLGGFIVIAVACAGWLWWQRPVSNLAYIPLKELPAISTNVLQANGHVIKVEEPILYNKTTHSAEFVVTILESKNLGEHQYLRFGGNAETLQNLINEVRFVDAPSTSLFLQGPWQATKGVVDGTKGLTQGVWHLIRHPVDSAKGAVTGVKGLASYTAKWYSGEKDIRKDIAELTKIYFLDLYCRVAREHNLDYLDLKTEQAKAAIRHEAYSRLGGRAVFEVAAVFVPFAIAKHGATAVEAGEAVVDGVRVTTAVADAAEAGGKLVDIIKTADNLAAAGRIETETSELIRYKSLFKESGIAAEHTVQRLKYAEKDAFIEKPIATLGRAATTDYTKTFFDAHPNLKGEVVVHHAIEQQALKRYPGILSEDELHSLENLRGIPRDRNSDLHLSQIRREWDQFYRENPANTVTKQKLLDKASEIDFKYGYLFKPGVK